MGRSNEEGAGLTKAAERGGQLMGGAQIAPPPLGAPYSLAVAADAIEQGGRGRSE
ncbi:MAG: hypothetical protein ABR929_11280 [Roseiarcus sp.]|jgi:hypothetical protein